MFGNGRSQLSIFDHLWGLFQKHSHVGMAPLATLAPKTEKMKRIIKNSLELDQPYTLQMSLVSNDRHSPPL